MSKREYNVDLYRILACILVIMLHVLGQGGVLWKAAPDGAVYWTAWFLEIVAYCSVNCFALVSGYVMVDKQIKTKRIIGLWIQVLFYSVLITSLFFTARPELKTTKDLLLSFLPIVGNQWWYISSYFALFLFIPFLNKAIEHISRQTYNKLLLVLLFVVGILARFVGADAFVLKNGYSPVWLAIVYLFGAYIRKYDLRSRITAAKSLIGFLVASALTFASKYGIRHWTRVILGQVKYEKLFLNHTSITMLLAAIFLLLFCLNIKTSPRAEKLIKLLSPTTLGVYLIHVHPLIFAHILKDAFLPFAGKTPLVMTLCVIATSCAIFVICAIIELLRMQLFKLLRIDKLCEQISTLLNRLYLKVFSQQKQNENSSV